MMLLLVCRIPVSKGEVMGAACRGIIRAEQRFAGEESELARIMLVDDDPKIVRSLELALQATGHEVCATAAGPDEALAALPDCRPDVMIVDVMMPTGTEGFHLVWAVRQLEDDGLKDTPIIMATGIHSHTEMRFYPDETDGTYRPGEFLPIQAWLDKPIQVKQLQSTLQEVLAEGD